MLLYWFQSTNDWFIYIELNVHWIILVLLGTKLKLF